MNDPRFSAARVRAAYETVARDYTEAFADDFTDLPVDRAMLDVICDRLGAGQLALDLGCGPAPVAAHLGARGISVIALDLAWEMLSVARDRVPSIAASQGDMRSLPFRKGSFGAVIAYYSIQHVSQDELPRVLREIARVLTDVGVLLLATHLGSGEVYIDEFLGHRIDTVGGALYERDELEEQLETAGFAVDVEEQRAPLTHEANTQRIYLLARKTYPRQTS